MQNSTDLISKSEALKRWRQALADCYWLESCPVVEMEVTAARGRVTAEAVHAVRSVPHYVAAAMDGYAVHSDDTRQAGKAGPLLLKVLPSGHLLMPGTAVVVDTGDALPAGADCVVMNEQAVRRDAMIEMAEPVTAGKNVRKIGEDIMRGDLVLPAGRLIGPAEIAACLAAGADRILVMEKARITVIPTGTEIVDSAADLPPGKIRDLNSHMLAALFESWGAKVTRGEVVSDDPDRLRQAISAAVSVSDLVVVNAGTSDGTEDFSAQVMGEMGTLYCRSVAIRPGRPVILGLIDGKPVAGLPGYPVSCMLTAELFLQELLHEYQHRPVPHRTTVKARMGRPVESLPGIEEYLRVVLKPEESYPLAMPLPRGASLISSLTRADGLLVIAPETTEIRVGDWVEVELF